MKAFTKRVPKLVCGCSESTSARSLCQSTRDVRSPAVCDVHANVDQRKEGAARVLSSWAIIGVCAKLSVHCMWQAATPNDKSKPSSAILSTSGLAENEEQLASPAILQAASKPGFAVDSDRSADGAAKVASVTETLDDKSKPSSSAVSSNAGNALVEDAKELPSLSMCVLN